MMEVIGWPNAFQCVLPCLPKPDSAATAAPSTTLWNYKQWSLFVQLLSQVLDYSSVFFNYLINQPKVIMFLHGDQTLVSRQEKKENCSWNSQFIHIPIIFMISLQHCRWYWSSKHHVALVLVRVWHWNSKQLKIQKKSNKDREKSK